MKRRMGIGIVVLTTMALLIGLMGVASVSASKKKGSEGCTPGYWKQSQHFDSWTAPYDPTDTFASVGFESSALSGMTLLAVLEQGGGGLAALGRHTVAALLNVASAGVDYPYFSVDTVIAQFNAANPGNIEGQKDIFAAFNELGCPLN
jgi:hypothetical protein